MTARREGMWQTRTIVGLFLTVAVAVVSCGSTDSTSTSSDVSTATAPLPTDVEIMVSTPPATEPTATPAADPVTTDQSATNAEPSQPEPAEVVGFDNVDRPASPGGRVAPIVAADATGLAQQVADAQRGLRAEGATAAELADWGHLHQVAIRKLGYHPEWDVEFFEALPSEFLAATLLHTSARRSLIDLSSGYDAADFIPAWEIVEPEPAANLVSYYQAAEAATGIEWEYLAAINLVETGMGRIRGLSSAGAQGPMQFLPTTWAESGIGEGDINDPSDAINGAARYLVRRGGPTDMPGAIWGYNNSDNYVSAVRAYAELLRQDPAAYTAIYNWEIYFFTEAGDIWLPAGFRADETLDLYEFLAENPWSAPDPGLR